MILHAPTLAAVPQVTAQRRRAAMFERPDRPALIGVQRGSALPVRGQEAAQRADHRVGHDTADQRGS